MADTSSRRRRRYGQENTINLYLGEDLIADLQAIAEQQDRTLSWLARRVLREFVTRRHARLKGKGGQNEGA
jgi:predicted transcriptional regulator